MNNEEKKQKKDIRPSTSIQTLTATNPETREIADGGNITKEPLKPLCPLLAKDSEWVDIIQTTTTNDKKPDKNNDEEEAVCEDGPQMKPLALMFPGLLEKDPKMLEGMLNKAMSTTEVTKYLVGQKANFSFMKKVNRLIPTDKKWLESLTEDSTSSCCSMDSTFHDDGLSDLIVDETDDSLDTHKS